MKAFIRAATLSALTAILLNGPATGQPPSETAGRNLNVLVLLGEWFGDAYFPLAQEIEARGWAMKRVGVDAEYRGCYNKKRDVVLRSDILIPELKDFADYDCLIIPSGPQFRKFKDDQIVLKFVRDAHAAGLVVASFCVGNNTVRDAGLIDLPYGPSLFPEKVTLVRERVLIGPRGGGPPPGDGFESAPVKEICDAVAHELARSRAAGGTARTTSAKAPVEAGPQGGAVVWYLGHCGYAVRTADHLLIFDYQEERDGQQAKSRPDRPELANGWIDPQEIKGLKVKVFVSHSHDDHFDPVIFTWKEAVPDIAYYFGWRAADDPSHHYLTGPRTELSSGGLEIATINSHHSGVPEVAWLVKVDGLVIYHNGDCQPDDPIAEYAFLRAKTGSIDLAFVPPVFEEGQKYTLQNVDLFTKFRVRAAFPMHVQAGGDRYRDFQKALGAKFPGLPIVVPAATGQKFVFARGGIQVR